MCGKSRLSFSVLDLFRVTVVFEPLRLVFQIPGSREEFLRGNCIEITALS